MLFLLHTYSRNEPLGPLSIVHSIGRDEAHFTLSHQLSLGSRGRFDQSAGGCSDGLGCLQNLLLEVQRLIRLLRGKETNESDRMILLKAKVVVFTFSTTRDLNGTLFGMEKVASD